MEMIEAAFLRGMLTQATCLAVHCSNLLKSNMSPHWGFSWRDPSVTLAP
ncbi:hypothetical protein [Mesorhizobium shangrilense]|uniref:Uncharacterized protein n=1 Tax=Mesorhizobium shangrilense TaxID=460060 RepID=A0ABV2D9F1_9HYPH